MSPVTQTLGPTAPEVHIGALYVPLAPAITDSDLPDRYSLDALDQNLVFPSHNTPADGLGLFVLSHTPDSPYEGPVDCLAIASIDMDGKGSVLADFSKELPPATKLFFVKAIKKHLGSTVPEFEGGIVVHQTEPEVRGGYVRKLNRECVQAAAGVGIQACLAENQRVGSSRTVSRADNCSNPKATKVEATVS